MKKRILSFVLVLCLMLSALPISAVAQTTVTEEETLLWQYELIDGGVTLTAYNGDATDVYVPASITVNGTEYAVLKLSDGVFENNDSLNSVTLGDGVLEIGNRAFYDCDNLVCILLSQKTTTIGSL